MPTRPTARSSVAAFGWLVAAATVGVPAFAFDRALTDHGAPLWWPRGELSWAAVGPAVDASVVERAAQAWNAADCPPLRLRPARAGEYADIVVRVDAGPWPHAADEAAWTTLRADSNRGRAWHADIALNARWWHSGAVDEPALVVHEFGHALGLGHTIDRATVMFGGLGRRTTLADDDRLGVCAVFAKAVAPAARRSQQWGWLAAALPLAWLVVRAGRSRPAWPGTDARRR